jgi:hypothetical protein
LKEIYRDKMGALKINCNNQEGMMLSKDNKFNACTKHIDICYHFIDKAAESGKTTTNGGAKGEVTGLGEQNNVTL